MELLKRSDFWFGGSVFVFYALAASIFFIPSLTDLSFISEMLWLLGTIALVQIMRRPLGKLETPPRSISWFSIGVTCVAIRSVIVGDSFDLLPAGFLGVFLAVLHVAGSRGDRDG